MSQFYDQASLVMVPSGYKAGKVYSQKPLSTDGELTFTRNSNATRVNSAGKVEKVRTNLALYSQDLSNAAYTDNGDAGYSVIKTANYTTAPNGTQTATRVQITRGSSYAELYQRTTIASGIEFTVSFWGKALSGTPTLSTAYNAGYFNLVTFTSEWVRYTYTAISSGVASAQGFNLLTWSNLPTTSTSADVAIWGVQIETGVATDYIATTSAAVSVGPTANVPRLNYSNGCPSLLLEPQRTNEMPYSEYLAGWTLFNNIAITQNQTTSPEGVTNGVLMARTGSGDLFGAVRYTGISTTANSKCFSIFAKANAHNFIQLYHSGDAQGYVNFDLSTGAVGTSGSKASGTIESYGSGWYRCTAIYDNTNTFGSSYYVGFAASASSGYVGGAVPDTASVYLYGAQIESSASYPSSYLPTYGASVTRLADSASRINIANLIGQTEGTLFVDLDLTSRSNFSYFAIAPNLASASTYIGIGITLNAFSFEVLNSGIQVAYNFPNTSTGHFKLALAYKANDFVAYVNGTQVHSDTSGTVPVCSQLGLNAYNTAASFNYNQALLFKTRLSNADLANLTAL